MALAYIVFSITSTISYTDYTCTKITLYGTDLFCRCLCLWFCRLSKTSHGRFFAAGFVCIWLATTTVLLDQIAVLGITLLLFSILKLKVSSLIKCRCGSPPVFIIISTALFCGFLLLPGCSPCLFIDLNWQTALLLGFAFSFSSTVLPLKCEDRGEMSSLHGKISIGILVTRHSRCYF